MSTAVGGKAFWGRARVVLGVLAAAVFSTLVLVGCGKDDDTGGGNLACADGEAWVRCYDDDPNDCEGIIFKSNGEFRVLFTEYGNWVEAEDEAGTWSTSGNTVTITYTSGEYTGDVDTFNYSVSGNTLTISDSDGSGQKLVFTKRSGINIGMSKSREGNEVSTRLFKR
jgi:hypothetical protein